MKVKKESGRTWTNRLALVKCRLGSKQEPYLKTEKEMLSDKKYTYSTLSISERKIFNKLKSTKNGNK